MPEPALLDSLTLAAQKDQTIYRRKPNNLGWPGASTAAVEDRGLDPRAAPSIDVGFRGPSGGSFTTIWPESEASQRTFPAKEWTATNGGTRSDQSTLEGEQSAKTKQRTSTPPVERLVQNHHFLTPLNTNLLRRLYGIVTSKANKGAFEITRFAVDIEDDPDEETTVIAFRAYANATATQTFAFWDSLEIELGNWFETLKPLERRAIREKIGLRFHWSRQ